MRHARTHGKVWLWWSPWWAVQLMAMPELALGVRLEWRRPLLDIYVGPLSIALGRNPIRTPSEQKQRNSCRGFVIAGQPEDALL